MTFSVPICGVEIAGVGVARSNRARSDVLAFMLGERQRANSGGGRRIHQVERTGQIARIAER